MPIDKQYEVLHGLFKELLRGPYDDLERQQISPRNPQQTLPLVHRKTSHPIPTINLAPCPKTNIAKKLVPCPTANPVKNFTFRDIYASGGGLPVASIKAPHLFDVCRVIPLRHMVARANPRPPTFSVSEAVTTEIR